MVSKKDIKGYDFETIEDYYNYILESKINGQMSQARNLVAKLSKEQKIECVHHLDVSLHYEIEDNNDQKELEDFYIKVGLKRY